jgi:hypothetical protein
MQSYLQGRINKCQLSRKKGLLPVFEAVINSLQSIEARKNLDGRVTIHITRDQSQAKIEGVDTICPISGFTITDNGAGFTQANYESFDTYDSPYKFASGGKGVGRLSWLVAFENAKIESTYMAGPDRWERRFDFNIPSNGILPITHEQTKEGPIETTITLQGFKPAYRDEIAGNQVAIAEAILEHCLPFFFNPACPIIAVTDDDSPTKIVLNDLYRETVGSAREPKDFKVGEHIFKINHLRSNKSSQRHSLHLCAHGRSVIRKNLADEIPNLGSRIPTEKGDSGWVYSGYVSGDYLDKMVNPERTDFRFPKDDGLLPDDITEDKFISAAVGEAASKLDPHLQKNRVALHERVRKVIEDEMPEGRPILRHMERFVTTINPSIDAKTLRRRINEATFAHEMEVKETVTTLIEKIVAENPTIEQAKEKAESIIAEVMETSKSKLAGYVAFRKAVLEIYQKQIGLQSNGKFSREDVVHDLIFPRRSTSNDVDADDHNLWIVDDRLAFHQLLASDVPFENLQEIAVDSKKRPDLLVVNKPAAFTNSDTCSSVVIVELKRPARDDYDGNDNPIDQVLEYIELIRAGKARRTNGAHLVISPQSPFFVHILSGITPGLRLIISRRNIFNPTPDGMGYFGYAKEHNAYIEITSFEKLIQDAAKRNHVWFTKLGIA